MEVLLLGMLPCWCHSRVLKELRLRPELKPWPVDPRKVVDLGPESSRVPIELTLVCLMIAQPPGQAVDPGGGQQLHSCYLSPTSHSRVIS